jgi:hypothetical protein
MWQERQILDYFAALGRQIFGGALTKFACDFTVLSAPSIRLETPRDKSAAMGSEASAAHGDVIGRIAAKDPA